MLTEEQWGKIDKKYGNLMYKISHKISGDVATAGFDDNLQDIRMAAVEAVIGFEKQNSGANGKFEDFWGSKGFDRYMKTVLWTKKNNKGAKITKKSPILKGTVSTDKEEVLMMEADVVDIDSALFIEELALSVTEEQREVLTLLVQDPSYIKPSGKINIKKLSEDLDLSWYEAKKLLEGIPYLVTAV